MKQKKQAKSYWFIAAILFLTIFFQMPQQVFAKNENSVADDASVYLNYIGENLVDRSALTEQNRDESTNMHEETTTWIINQLVDMGVDLKQIKEQNFQKKEIGATEKYDVTNIVVTLKGISEKKQIIVGAHYDGDGFADNGSGISLMLAQIKKLQKVNLPYTVKFVFFDAEEVGELGSKYYVSHMSLFEKNKTLYMVNIDSIAFGDYCNIYGGVQIDSKQQVVQTEAYELAMKKAKELGIEVYDSDRLNGYFKENGMGPSIKENAVYTNPWTYENPSPKQAGELPYYASPSTGDWGDHDAFRTAGMEYIYFEATNWFSDGEGIEDGTAYTGYYDTQDKKLGESGQFMNTKYDTMVNLYRYFPGRVENHFKIYAQILEKIIVEPDETIHRKMKVIDAIYIIGVAISCILLIFVIKFFWHIKNSKMIDDSEK